MRQAKTADRDYDAAYAALPWWAKAGPRFLRSDGSLTGEDWGWPAIQNMAPPYHPLAHRLIRPSFATIRETFEHQVAIWRPRPAARAKYRASYRKQVRELVARLRARDAERKGVGLDDIEDRMETLADELGAVEDALRDFPDDCGDPAVTAAKILLATPWEAVEDTQCPADADCNGIALVGILRTLRPAFSGLLAQYVGDILDSASLPFCRCEFLAKGIVSTEG